MNVLWATGPASVQTVQERLTEIDTPAKPGHRRIEAIGDSLDECVRMLTSRGLDPANFEFQRLAPPY